MDHKVAILLPTYNGEKFLIAQLNSLLDQSHENFVVVARDDGSSDGTTDLLSKFQSKHPEIIHLLKADGKNLGASASFALLMTYVLANKKELGLHKAYLMFCDQDDVWQKNKIESQLALLLKMETSHGEKLPILIHSDLRVVTETGEVIAESFLEFQGLDAGRNKFSQVLVSNKVTGCTAMVNEALLIKSLPVPDHAIMHDWWLGLVASAFGRAEFIPRTLVDYRQHHDNTIGAKRYVVQKPFSSVRLKKALDNRPVTLHHDVANQAAAFLDCYGLELSSLQKMQLRAVTSLKSRSGILQRLLFRMLC